MLRKIMAVSNTDVILLIDMEKMALIMLSVFFRPRFSTSDRVILYICPSFLLKKRDGDNAK
jgi:hypothetical protein